MFVPLLDFLKPSKDNPLARELTGIVVDDKDPQNLGRVKIKIPTIFEGDVKNLPWVYPKNPPDQGGKGDGSGHQKPQKNSHVMVTFPTGDIYHPQYGGVPTTPQSMQKLFQNNPLTEIWNIVGGLTGGSNESTLFGKVWNSGQSKALSWTRTDKARGTTETYHGNSENLSRIDGSGNVVEHRKGENLEKNKGDSTIDTDQDKHIRVGRDLIFTVGRHLIFKVGGKFTATITDKMEFHGQEDMCLWSEKRLLFTPDPISGKLEIADSQKSSIQDPKVSALDQKVTKLNTMLGQLKQQHDETKAQASDYDQKNAKAAAELTGDNI